MFRMAGDLSIDPWYMLWMRRFSGARLFWIDRYDDGRFVLDSTNQGCPNVSNSIITGNNSQNDIRLSAGAKNFRFMQMENWLARVFQQIGSWRN
jgi:hypothetical protein